ncbi:MAG: monovalent cation/H+ antiporter subunit D family protein [Hyphomicrobiaceae bacterium]|nr:monovalent cation/H+ antiporter subunit D family protein [Hyphomicrobiaceae bacterium]
MFAEPTTLVLLALVIPLVAAVLIPLFNNQPNLREAVTLLAAGSVAVVVWSLYGPVMAGARPELHGPEIVPGISLGLKVEPLGLIYALVASTLWIVNSIYSIGYMRDNSEPRQTSFYVCFAVAISSAIAIAFSANLVTLFLAYEVLTVSTYPLVTHKATDDARKAGRKYLLLLIGTSMVLLLPAIIATSAIAGTAEFTPGGILANKLAPAAMMGLLALYVFGIGKAAVMPVHFWLPAAMVAPTPVSALLHAVAVVKAGVFSILKIVVYVFGIDTLQTTGAADWLIWVPAGTIIVASLIAMTKDNLKARLAYSTISQLSYIVTGALLATSLGVVGSGFHIVTHAVGKITLFFCAGAIYTALHKTEISELTGLGKVMPFTFAAFTIGTLSIIGLPPLGGTWSKWYLALGAIEGHKLAIVAILMISSLLNIAYLLPIPFKAFFGKRPASAGAAATHGHAHDHADGKIHEAPTACLIAIGATSLGCVLLFFYPDFVFDLLKQIPLR